PSPTRGHRRGGRMSEPAPAPVATATRPTPRLLIVDDEQSVRDFLRLLFEDSGYAIQEADSVRGARRLLDRLRFDVALCDLKMPDGSGLDLLREIRAQDSSTSVILMTAHGSHQVAVEAMKAGAYD